MSKGGTKATTQSTNPQWFDDAGKELWGYAKSSIFQPKPKAATSTTSTTATAKPTATAAKPDPFGFDYVRGRSDPNYLSQAATTPVQTNDSQELSNEFKPYESYDGQRVAGLSDNQNYASNVASSFASDHGGYFNNAKNWLNQAVTPFGKEYDPNTIDTGKFGMAEAENYMNPFIKMALDPTANEIQRAAQIAKMQQNAGQVSRNSFGGGRQAIMDSELTRNTLDKTKALYSEGYASAFDKAMAGFMQDAQRKLQGDTVNEANRFSAFESGRDQKNKEANNFLQAASSAGNLATQKSNIISQDVDRLMKTGQQTQQNNQNNLDWAYQQAQEKKNFDKDQLSWLASILNGTGAKGSQQTVQTPQNNTLGTLIGAGGTILGGMASGGTGFFAASDVRLKQNVKTVGYQKGHRIIEFQYKGSDAKYRGVIAQEVQKVKPEAVREQDGFLAVDYGMIGIPFEPIESNSHGKFAH